jgi:ribose 5-phosphate isomerase B
MAKPLISEHAVRQVIARGEKKIVVPAGAIVTPLAAELIASHNILVVDKEAVRQEEKPAEPRSGPGSEKVAIGSDHGGFALKEILKAHISTLGFQVVDLGTTSEEPCDYPDFAYAVARAVSTGECWRGIVIDGAGIGSAIVANKVPGVRAACCHNEFVARNSREHNDANVLTLGSRVVGSEVCKEVVKVWLHSWFAGGRHKVRVEKMIDVERRYLKE